MYIKEKFTQIRRDFRAIYKCEHCGHELEGTGYDDTYFHNEVVPGMVCGKCDKKADLTKYKPMTPKYPDGYQV